MSIPADALQTGATSEIAFTIAAVERDTRISKDTLRIWERRYQFPVPERDAFGERVYPPEQIDKLRIIKRLMALGMRPGKLMRYSLEELRALRPPAAGNTAGNKGRGDGHTDAGKASASSELQSMIDLILQHRIDRLRATLGQQVLRLGLARFVIDIVAPLNEAVGEAWVVGELAIFEEHLYTESVKVVLRNAIASVPRHAGTPRVLLTTFPREEHALGLLMAEAVLAIDGAHCISLGVETPLPEIVRAAVSQQADIIALSFSAAYPANGLADALAELRAALPASIAVWAGGAAVAQLRRPPPGVGILHHLDALHEALVGWRAGHPGA
jgi:DNA-binding transcriptional MerR regulator/methylmalonyl-CoA mutase cobalamin-binding subunit